MTSTKQKIVDLFEELHHCHTYLKDEWRARASQKVAMIVGGLAKDIKTADDLKGVTGIGKSSLTKIDELLTTGTCSALVKLQKKCPPISVKELTKIPGVGPVGAANLWKEHGVETLGQLKVKVDDGTITDCKLIEGIEFAIKSTERRPIGQILPVVEPFLEALRRLENVEQAEFAGSLRRRQDTIRDVDFLVCIPDSLLTTDDSSFERLKEQVKSVFAGCEVDAEGTHKMRTRVDGMQMDVLFVPETQYGAALQYFTGSKHHNIALRKIVKAKGWLLNEKGLYDGNDNVIASKTEEDIYDALGIPMLPPELRQDGTEVGKTAPELIDVKDVKGLLHNHTKWSDGAHTIEEMVQEAIARELKYMAITDHSPSMAIASGLSVDQWLEQHQAVEDIRARYDGQIQILHSSEMDVLQDGSIDYPNEIVQQFDFILLALHRLPGENIATRFISAIEHIRNVEPEKLLILAHPSGRKFGKSPVGQTDWAKLFRVCAENRVVLEINSLPERLDLDYTLVKQARDEGIKFAVNTDSHHTSHMSYVPLGVNVARRAWLSANDVINTKELVI